MAKSKIIGKRASGKSKVEERIQADKVLDLNTKSGTKLEKKKAELIEAKENYYRLCREFIELWTKTNRAQRGV
jgi:hypothetical protein